VGAQLGAVMDGPAEHVDVLQPLLRGQQIHVPSGGEGFEPKQALLSALAGIRRLTVEVRL